MCIYSGTDGRTDIGDNDDWNDNCGWVPPTDKDRMQYLRDNEVENMIPINWYKRVFIRVQRWLPSRPYVRPCDLVERANDYVLR